MITFIQKLLAVRKSRREFEIYVRSRTVKLIRAKARTIATEGWVHHGYGCMTVSSDGRGLWLSELEQILDEVNP